LPEKILFGAGEQMTIADTGIMGLSLANNSAFSQAIAQQVFKQPIFTIFLQKCSSKSELCDGGSMTFGDYDLTHCEPIHTWLPLLNGSKLWQLKIDGFEIDGVKIDYPVTVS
jgi:hypothetical protein